MKKRLSLICIIVLIPALFIVGNSKAESDVFIHFIVVSNTPAEGMEISESLAFLKKKLVELAGGYTYLGATQGGWLPPGGKLDEESNHSFLVSAPKNVTAELEKSISSLFKMQKPFILVWRGEGNY